MRHVDTCAECTDRYLELSAAEQELPRVIAELVLADITPKYLAELTEGTLKLIGGAAPNLAGASISAVQVAAVSAVLLAGVAIYLGTASSDESDGSVLAQSVTPIAQSVAGSGSPSEAPTPSAAISSSSEATAVPEKTSGDVGQVSQRREGGARVVEVSTGSSSDFDQVQIALPDGFTADVDDPRWDCRGDGASMTCDRKQPAEKLQLRVQGEENSPGSLRVEWDSGADAIETPLR